MLTSYHDEGVKDVGELREQFIVVCGMVSTVKQWESFDPEWREFLARFEVPYFHMKEFSQSKGPFTKWKNLEEKRAFFCCMAAATIRKRVKYGFIFFIRRTVFDYVDKIFDVSGVWSSPYGLAGRCCMELVEDWRQKHRNSENIEYVFDDDGPDKEGLIHAMTSIEPFLPIPSFKPSRDRKKSHKWPDGRKGLMQLQAVDYLAYEARKAMADKLERGIPAARKSLQAILGVSRMRMSPLNEMGFAKFCYCRGVKRRQPEDSDIYKEIGRICKQKN